MSLENYFERMQSEIRAEIARKAEEQRQQQEHEERMRAALQPYKDQGLSFADVVARTSCPGSAYELYQSLTPRQGAAKEKNEEEQPDPFVKGFLSDPYTPNAYRHNKNTA